MIKFILPLIIALSFKLWAVDIPVESGSNNTRYNVSLEKTP